MSSVGGADSPCILLVEDDPLNRELAEDLLRLAGFCVCTAGTGTEALQAAHGQKPDLILLDMQLPEMDGLQVVARLRGDPETAAIPVVAFTAHAMAGDEEKYLAAGCNGYIAKPIDTRRFADQVAAYLPGSADKGG